MTRNNLFLKVALSLILMTIGNPAWGHDAKTKKIEIISDRLEYRHEEERYFAEKATLIQGETTLKVNTLWLDNKTKQLKGDGDVIFSDDDNTIQAQKIELNLLSKQGVLLDGTIFIKEENYTLTGKRIERFDLNHFALHTATFTACDCQKGETPSWQIRASRLRLTPKSYLVVNHLVFYIYKVPIFYFPYFVYPVKTTRQGGLLIPDIGYNRKNGIRYRQDIFLTLGQSQDLTLSFDFRNDVGKGGGLEYRYAFSTMRGALQTDFFQDQIKKTDRFSIHYNHQQRFSKRIDLKIDSRYVSEGNYLSELSDQTSDRASQSIVSNGLITYQGDQSIAYLLGRYTQDLTATINTKPLQRLPEAGWRLMAYPIGPFYFSAETTYTRFVKDKIDWQRIDLFPTLSWPIHLASAMTLTPWAGYRPVWYNHRPSTNDPFDCNAVVKGVAFNSELSGGRKRLATILNYEQVEAEDRSDVFVADDLDRIHSRESVTLSLNPRLLTQDQKQEWGSIRFTETYHIEPLAGNVDRYSDLRGEIAIRSVFKIDSFYHWADHDFSAVNADLHLKGGEWIKMTVGERFSRGGVLPQKGDPFNPLYLGDSLPASRIEFITARLLVNPKGRIRLAVQTYYDQKQRQPIEMHYGLLYLTQCWSFTVAYQVLPNRDDIFFTVNLKGLGESSPKRFAYLFDF